MEARLLQLELSMDAAKRDIEELKESVSSLTFMITQLNISINDLIDSK